MGIHKNPFLFTLFHHDIRHHEDLDIYDTVYLYSLSAKRGFNDLKDIADSLFSIVTENIKKHKDSEISLTLTGGFDSRVILACLLKAGIKPNCLTYGNTLAKDIIFARNLANSFGLKFHNACKEQPTKEWYLKWVVETIKRDRGNSHLHRAHRVASIAEHVDLYSPKVLFTGHMGGEGLRGLSYNNYFASPFFELANEKKAPRSEIARNVLDNYFMKFSAAELINILDSVNKLSWMKHDRDINKFFFLYDLVGKIHHTQDIRLYKTFVPVVVPVFLQEQYLEKLFSSEYSFLAKHGSIFGSITNPTVHCKLIQLIYPKLLDYPLSNGFTPAEYLKGLWYYIPVKTYWNFKQKSQFPSTFSYGSWYVDFVKEHSQNISPDIWTFYDKEKYMKALGRGNHGEDEGYWHKFSNPIYFDLVAKYEKGLL
jgi:hypothetical protein